MFLDKVWINVPIFNKIKYIIVLSSAENVWTEVRFSKDKIKINSQNVSLSISQYFVLNLHLNLMIPSKNWTFEFNNNTILLRNGVPDQLRRSRSFYQVNLFLLIQIFMVHGFKVWKTCGKQDPKHCLEYRHYCMQSIYLLPLEIVWTSAKTFKPQLTFYIYSYYNDKHLWGD